MNAEKAYAAYLDARSRAWRAFDELNAARGRGDDTKAHNRRYLDAVQKVEDAWQIYQRAELKK